jgi:hypothetical protein
MKPKHITSSKPKKLKPKWLSAAQAEVMIKLIKSMAGAIIGLTITGLFSLVVTTMVLFAFQSEASQAAQLFNSASTLIGSALGAALGYFLGRKS